MPHGLPRFVDAARSVPPPPQDGVAMQQLRHHTKNALQRIIALVNAGDLRNSPAGHRLADEIERRICLSVQISDALFGMTAPPDLLENRLAALCDGTVALLAAPQQAIAIETRIEGQCPDPLAALVLRVAHEMVGNAVKHGLYMRATGRIVVRLAVPRRDAALARATTLTVSDNGWGPAPTHNGATQARIEKARIEKAGVTQAGVTQAGAAQDGTGFPIMRALADSWGGEVTLGRHDGWTIACLRVAGMA